MAWELKVDHEFERETLNPMVESIAMTVLDDGESIESALHNGIDEYLKMNVTILESIQYAGLTSKAFGAVYEEFVELIADRVLDIIE